MCLLIAFDFLCDTTPVKLSCLVVLLTGVIAHQLEIVDKEFIDWKMGNIYDMSF